MIFQDPIESLNPKMTIEEIVGEGLKVRGQKDRDEIHRQVVEMLEKVGLVEEHATRYPVMGLGSGIAESKAFVYGCSGFLYRSSPFATSTRWP